MTPHSIEQAVGVTAHRPMSLLLQALKQIESKSPPRYQTNAPEVEGGRSRYSIASPQGEQGFDARNDGLQKEGLLAELPPIVVVPNHGATLVQPLSGSTYQLYRRYDESETASEIAVADTVELAALRNIPLDAKRPVAVPNRRIQREQREYAEQIVRLLPEESHAVIAIVPVEGIDSAAVVLNVAESLAAHGDDRVLAIAEFEAVGSEADRMHPTLADVVAGAADLSEALLTDGHGEVSLLMRGDCRQLANVSKRRLLKTWEDFGARFAFVVLDATAGKTGDTTALLATCDAAFIALRLNQTHRRHAEQLVETVRAQGCQPCGCLVVDRCA